MIVPNSMLSYVCTLESIWIIKESGMFLEPQAGKTALSNVCNFVHLNQNQTSHFNIFIYFQSAPSGPLLMMLLLAKTKT